MFLNMRVLCQQVLFLSCICISKSFNLLHHPKRFTIQTIVSPAYNSKYKKNNMTKLYTTNTKQEEVTTQTLTTSKLNPSSTTKGKVKKQHLSQQPKNNDSLNTTKSNPILLSISPSIQNYIRDSGILSNIIDTLTRLVAGPAFYIENPKCFPEFIRISEYPHWMAVAASQILSYWLNNVISSPAMNERTGRSRDKNVPNEQNAIRSIHPSSSSQRVLFHKESYGSHKRQMANVMINESLPSSSLDTSTTPPPPLYIFFHGGAWCSGFPTMYRLIASPFLQKGYRAIVLGYRTYPDGTMEDQLDDLVTAVQYFTDKYTTTIGSNIRSKVVLMGHSSGAQITMLAALQGRLNDKIDALIGMSGVYDLELARKREVEQGLVHLSPMVPACKGMLKEFSPSHHVDINSFKDDKKGSSFLKSRSRSHSSLRRLPPILLLHGADDEVAPPEYSTLFHDSILETHNYKEKLGIENCNIHIVENVGHQDTVLETCIGGSCQSTIFEWIEQVVWDEK